MFERSVYYRAEAGRCLWHADNVADAETQEDLRTLAVEYIMRAVAIENKQQRFRASTY
jgi:hypothetical protein